MVVDARASLLTVVVLFHDARLLLLKRAAWKTFAPNRWTGIGGKVEPDELGWLASSARRELFEETDLGPTEVSELTLRRTLTFFRVDEGLVSLLYFTGKTASDRVPVCNEGTLAWFYPVELRRLDLLQNTGAVLRLLVEDVLSGASGVRCGVARLDEHDNFVDVVFN